MLQEADNRIHSDSIHCYKRQNNRIYTLTDNIHCYKRQTIEYTLTVYTVTRGRQ